MKNISPTAVSALLLAAAWIIAGCAASAPPVVRVALLAPFEGRYREIGYDLLYAARLGLADAGYTHVVLLPVDDGGTPQTAAMRARALAHDPTVKAVMLAGYAATDSQTLTALTDLPAIVIGHWGGVDDESVLVLASETLNAEIETPARADVIDAAELPAPLVCGEVCALKQFVKLRADLESVQVMTSAAPPDADFVSRYVSSGLFVEPPGLLVTLGYDAARLLAETTADAAPRGTLRARLHALEYTGINGRISFVQGYWQDAPVYTYLYRDGVLSCENCP